PDSMLTERRNADAYLLNGWQDAEEDRVKYLGVRDVSGKFGTATLMMDGRRVKMGDKASWRVGCVGFRKEDKDDPFAHAFEEWSSKRVSDREDLDDELEDLVSEVRYTGRKHWSEERRYRPWMYD